MSKKQMLMVLGVWVMLFLFLGFPESLDKVFALITGLLIIAITLKFRSENVRPIATDRVPFVEHKNITNPDSEPTP